MPTQDISDGGLSTLSPPPHQYWLTCSGDPGPSDACRAAGWGCDMSGNISPGGKDNRRQKYFFFHTFPWVNVDKGYAPKTLSLDGKANCLVTHETLSGVLISESSSYWFPNHLGPCSVSCGACWCRQVTHWWAFCHKIDVKIRIWEASEESLNLDRTSVCSGMESVAQSGLAVTPFIWYRFKCGTTLFPASLDAIL